MPSVPDPYKVLQVDPDAHDAVVRAAFRALAALYHPDRDPSPEATRRMADLNAAYEMLRSRDRREVHDRLRRAQASPGPARASVEPIVPPPPRSRNGGGDARLDFGRYAGWTIDQLAREDPDYLRWLSRHSSGIRYRRVIEAALRAHAAPSPMPSKDKDRRKKR